MENRFGLKDLVLILLVVVIIVMIGLKMKQDDRAWQLLGQISNKLDQQTKDITALRRTISRGGGHVSSTTPAATRQIGGEGAQREIGGVETVSESGDIFRRLRGVRDRPDFAEGDVWIEAFQSAPPKLNYLTSHDLYSRMVYSRVLEGLAEWDLDRLEMVPHLAQSWSWSDDKLSLDVQLRPDVTFSDGELMTADDVVYTWMNLKKNPEITDGQDRAYYAPIKSVEKLGEHEVRFHFDKVFYENFMRAMEVPVLPRHFFEKYTDRQVRESPALVIGTGPYRLPDPTRYTPGEPIVLVRNERYWGVPPAFDKLIFRIIESESTELVAFRNGEIDVIVPNADQHLEMLQDTKLIDNTQHHVYEHVRSGYYYISWNQERGGKPTVFADKRVRQAMTLLLDRQRLCEELLKGFSVVADGPFHWMNDQHSPNVAPWPYDQQRGVELLEESGFTQDKDGRMIRPDGEPFVITLSYPSGSETTKKIALFFKDNLARAGIELKLDPQEWAVYLKNHIEKNFDATMSGWGGGSIEGDIEQMFHSKNIEEGDNRNGYVNEELDELIETAHVTLDRDERMKIWHRTHEILHEDQPYTFISTPKVRVWMDDRIANVQRIPVLGLNRVSTWMVPIEWYVPKDLQKHAAQ